MEKYSKRNGTNVFPDLAVMLVMEEDTDIERELQQQPLKSQDVMENIVDKDIDTKPEQPPISQNVMENIVDKDIDTESEQPLTSQSVMENIVDINDVMEIVVDTDTEKQLLHRNHTTESTPTIK